MVFSASKLESLSIRPPTPPKDLQDSDKDADDTLEFLQDPFGTKASPPKPIAPKTLLNTPVQSPSSDINIPSSSVGSRGKRVNFELQTCTIPHASAVAQSWTPANSSPLRPIPQTRVSKPLKSILKAFDPTSTPPPTDEGAAAHQFKTFPEMLESLVKMLAQGARSSRLDAYHALHRTMQAYEKVPDDQALRHKMPLLTQFVQRDIQAAGPNGTGLDSQLISQALKFLMALFRISTVVSAMNEDFCSFVVDRIIQVAGDATMPKTIVNTHLAVLMQQNFRPKTMSLSRTEKILDMLDTIHERVSGFSVMAYRIRIYKKLIQQRPEIMTKHTERWFKVTVKALLAGQKDINQSALDAILLASRTIGTDRQVSKAVLSVLNRKKSDGDTFGKVFSKELEKMLTTDNASMVPQIWSVVTGLLRDSLQVPLFPAMSDWLKIFEKCLLSDNDAVKVHANIAFCFLQYAVNVTYDTPPNWSKMFLKIPLQQLQRRGALKKAERDAVTSGYITLIYYAFRPMASHEQLDRYWAEFITDFWNPLVHSSSPIQSVAACRLVSALLKGCRRPWNEQRALELKPQLTIQREELPLLDPKWVRKSISTVLKFIENLLDATPWSENEIEDEPVKTMWLSVLDSLIEASSKEIMASTETKDAMAHIINLLRRVWDRHTTKLAISQQKEDIWADKFCFLIETVVQKLGAFRFSDKCLTRNGEDEFEVAPTPSHRSRSQGPRISPLLYCVDLLVNQSEGKLSDDVRSRAMYLILEPCFDAQNTRFSKLELLRDCSMIIDRSSKAVVAKDLWARIASLTTASIREQPPDSNERAARQLGKEYEAVVDILALGFPCLLNPGQDVLTSLVETVKREAGEGALVLAVIEKISECVLQRTIDEEKTTCVPYATTLLHNLPKTINRRSLDQSRQKLWPSSPSVSRNSDFDPYNHLYGAINSVGAAAYRDLDAEHVEPTRNFLNALAASIRNCSTSLLAVYLRKIQEVIRVWVEDSERKLQRKDEQINTVYHEVLNLWKEVSGAIERLPRKDGQILLHLESLITAGFTTRRRDILNLSITTWNSTFGKEESLRYPARLEQALRRLHSIVELSLPSLEPKKDDPSDALSLYDSDNSISAPVPHVRSPRYKESPFRITSSARKARSPAVSSTGSRRRSARQASKVRLRHDNSQIQFEPILSSPTNPFVQESQILTERQKEMIERQRFNNGIFANMGVSNQDSLPSPSLLHSDALSADDLPTEHARTPMKTLATMGPMDVYLGSSPTPYARKSTQQIVSDDTSVATPTAIRTIQAVGDELGSSPPRFEKIPDSISFDEGTTLEEDVLPELGPGEGKGEVDGEGEGESTSQEDQLEEDANSSDAPSSTIELQLTAQFDADIEAQLHQTQQSNASNEAVNGSAEVQDSLDPQESQEPIRSGRTKTSTERHMRSSNRVKDSFTEQGALTSTPTTRSLRRSTRHSDLSSPAASSLMESSSSRKRKQTVTEKATKTKKNKKEEPHDEQSQPQSYQPVDNGMLDNIVVASPATRTGRGKKRKSTEASVSDTSLRRSVRRSTSLLSQVESFSEEIAAEDIPAPKRARQDQSQDVSEVKPSSRRGSQEVQGKHLSQVRIMPKRLSKSSSVLNPSSAVEQNANVAPLLPSDTVDTELNESQRPSVVINTPSRSFAERVILTPRSIISRLKELKDYIASVPQLVLGRTEERDIDDALFDIRTYVHAAGRRGDQTRE